MASINQDFVTYQGDDVKPIFTVYAADGTTVVDISAVTEITWTARPQATDAASLTLTKTGGAITFVTTGTDGKFQVSVSAAQTLLLSGWYLHEATLTDAAGKVTTVSVGRMQVGLRPAWTYNPAQITTVPLYQVRRLIGDVINSDQQLSDDEITFALSQRPGIYGPAADCCRYIASQYSRKADTVAPGELRTAYSVQAGAYASRAAEFDTIARMRGAGAVVYAGGISVSDKQTNEVDPDRVAPQFNLAMMDNFTVPAIGPVGHETSSGPMSEAFGG
jgi:hypothetical protein